MARFTGNLTTIELGKLKSDEVPTYIGWCGQVFVFSAWGNRAFYVQVTGDAPGYAITRPQLTEMRNKEVWGFGSLTDALAYAQKMNEPDAIRTYNTDRPLGG